MAGTKQSASAVCDPAALDARPTAARRWQDDKHATSQSQEDALGDHAPSEAQTANGANVERHATERGFFAQAPKPPRSSKRGGRLTSAYHPERTTHAHQAPLSPIDDALQMYRHGTRRGSTGDKHPQGRELRGQLTAGKTCPAYLTWTCALTPASLPTPGNTHNRWTERSVPPIRQGRQCQHRGKEQKHYDPHLDPHTLAHKHMVSEKA